MNINSYIDKFSGNRDIDIVLPYDKFFKAFLIVYI